MKKLIFGLKGGCMEIKQNTKKRLIDKDRLIERLRYSSNWNQPCPDWVISAIEHTPEEMQE